MNVAQRSYQFSLYGELTDLDALYEAAKQHAIEEDGVPPDRVDEYVRDSDGEICVARCLHILLDPGILPGFEIIESCAE
jgi:hypothetical protein